jgi:hypothetical protein
MTKKRTFLLMEVLISLMLVSLCIVPLMRAPILHFRQQVNHLIQFERQRIADWSFSEVKEILLKNGIPWERLPKRGSARLELPLAKSQLHIPGLITKNLSRKVQFSCTAEKEGEKGGLYRLLEITILLDEEPMHPPYRVLIAKNSGSVA